jgi:hypothetical protein
MMTQIDILRNGIIDKLLTINDKNYLSSLLNLIDKSNFNSENIKLTKEQKILLQLSMKDIQNGEVISNDEVVKSDLEWLKGKYLDENCF